MPGGMARNCNDGSALFQLQPEGPGRFSVPFVVVGSLWGGNPTPRRRLDWHRNSPRRRPDPKPDRLLERQNPAASDTGPGYCSSGITCGDPVGPGPRRAAGSGVGLALEHLATAVETGRADVVAQMHLTGGGLDKPRPALGCHQHRTGADHRQPGAGAPGAGSLSGFGSGLRRGEFRCQSRRRRGVGLPTTTSRQQRMAPKIAPALRVEAGNGLIRRCNCAPCRQAWLCIAPRLSPLPASTQARPKARQTPSLSSSSRTSSTWYRLASFPGCGRCARHCSP